MHRRILLALFSVAPLFAQSSQSVIGTVAIVRANPSEMEIKPDAGEIRIIKVSADTVVQKVAPGEKDLRNAQAITPAEVHAGDRVLITLRADDAATARRVVVMAASDISKRNDADRLDWEKRGIAGVVTARNGSQITVRKRSFQGPVEARVEIGEGAIIRRYAPDSVAFADAKPSTPADIRIGDQLRARGSKSEDGLTVQATEIVFGTFTTRAGTVKEVRAGTHEVIIAEWNTNKPLTVKLTADSRLKQMPSFAGMNAGGPPGGGPAGPGARPAGGPEGGMRGPMGGMRGPGGPPDVAQMVERMPAATFEDLKPGEMIVVSSTKGVQEDSITAILLLANAEPLMRMATGQAARQGREGAAAPAGAPGPGMGGPGMGLGLGGLDLGSIMP